MRRLALLGALVVACTAQPSASTSSPATSATSTPSATPVSSPCRLAVIQGSPGHGSGPQTPGFLTIPGDVFTPAIDAGDGTFYDSPLKRWIGWGPPAMSADGTRYAYAEFLSATKTSRVHLVDVRSGTDQVVASGGPWVGVGLEADAFYVMRIEFIESVAYGNLQVDKGLWKLPLDGSKPTQLTSDARNWAWVADGGVYGDRSSLDVAGGPNDVVRYDLGTGQVTSWFNPHARASVLAVDAAGAALVTTEANDEEIWWRVTGPGNAVEVWSGPTDAIRPGGPVAADGSDVWLSSVSPVNSWAIYHFSSQAGLQQAAIFTDRPVTVAGPCA